VSADIISPRPLYRQEKSPVLIGQEALWTLEPIWTSREETVII